MKKRYRIGNIVYNSNKQITMGVLLICIIYRQDNILPEIFPVLGQWPIQFKIGDEVLVNETEDNGKHLIDILSVVKNEDPKKEYSIAKNHAEKFLNRFKQNLSMHRALSEFAIKSGMSNFISPHSF